jgi:hypothetical protein
VKSGGVLLYLCFVVALATTAPAIAGPPYLSDDPEPTDYRHFEIYTFNSGVVTSSDTSGETGIDFNYGGAPNLQLTATIPLAFDAPSDGPFVGGPGNVEFAAKYRFLTQQDFGLDVAVFPRVFLPSASSNVGDQHASLLLPIWVEKDWDKWSAFGGGGCEYNHAWDSQNFCLMGAVLTRQVSDTLQLGVEVFHQTPNVPGGAPTTSLGIGARYDLSENLHLLGCLNRTVQNAQQTDQFTWYASVLFTF